MEGHWAKIRLLFFVQVLFQMFCVSPNIQQMVLDFLKCT